MNSYSWEVIFVMKGAKRSCLSKTRTLFDFDFSVHESTSEFGSVFISGQIGTATYY